jgi:hypothetical protein
LYRYAAVFCELSPLQMRTYKRLIESEDFQLLVRHAEDCDCNSGEQRSKCCYSEPKGGGEEGIGTFHPTCYTVQILFAKKSKERKLKEKQ